MSRKTLAVIGAAIGVAIAHFDLLDYVLPSAEVTKAMPKADAPGVHTDFETGWGLAQKQQLKIADKYHGMLQLPFGVQAPTATITIMLAESGTAFGINVGADPSDQILISMMAIPDPSCDPTAPAGDSTVVLGDGSEVAVAMDCVHGDRGFARYYEIRDDAQRQTLSDYLTTAVIPVIKFPNFGNVPFDLSGYPDAVEAALAAPRIVPDPVPSSDEADSLAARNDLNTFNEDTL